MGQEDPLHVVVLHNRDFDHFDSSGDDRERASRADVENAAGDVARALELRGHRSQVLAVPSGDALAAVEWTLAEVRNLGPHLVFNLCESLGGDAQHEVVLPTLFDLAAIPYTGSGPLGLGLALRKDVAKRILQAHNLPTPAAICLEPGAAAPLRRQLERQALRWPLIVKPTREDASVGISRHSVVHEEAALRERVEAIWERYRQPALIEEYIDGRELYVSLLGNPPAPLPFHEIDFSLLPSDCPRIVSYEGKWNFDSDEYHGTRPCRARRLATPLRERIEAIAVAAFRALGLRDYARVDVRLSADGAPYIIDVNPNCDLSEGAGVARAASYGGIAYPDLIERICEAALARTQPARSQPESELHVDRTARPASNVTDPAPRRAGYSAPARKRSQRAGGAHLERSTLYEGGDLGRARAPRGRAR